MSNKRSRHFFRIRYRQSAAMMHAFLRANQDPDQVYKWAREAFHWASIYIESGGRWS